GLAICGRLGGFVAEDHGAIENVDQNWARLIDITGENAFAEFIHYLFLNKSLQGSGSKLRIKALLGEKFECVITELELYITLRDKFFQCIQLDADNAHNLFSHQWREHYDLINPVKEFGPYGLPEEIHYFGSGFIGNLFNILFIDRIEMILYEMTTDVACHDDDGVLEVYYPAFVIGEASIIKYLK